ncbi:MAG: chorismate synthase [Candidatus Omnitrophica bacterium]|nr:chorismate synthase [Candidatus Omnitrophota bacterium]
MLRFLTAGESHGKAVLAVLEGLPSGLKINKDFIDQELKKRQQGYGRGPRMKIEEDKVEIISGIKSGFSIGSPLGLMIKNKDFSIERLSQLFCPRPGHADLAGALKYGFKDIRFVLERASARETAARVAVGAICKLFLKEFNIFIKSKVLSIGGQTKKNQMLQKIKEAKEKKDTVGGIFEIVAKGLPVGLGSYVQWDRRLDARLAEAIISIPGIKAIEFGLGFGYADKFGSEVHDAIYYSKSKGYFRKTNHAGGIEGGISNGQELIIRACMKPISTLLNPLDSVNILTKKPAKAVVERADICVVEAGGVIAESCAAFVIADAFLEKFGADSLSDIKVNYKNYLKRIR